MRRPSISTISKRQPWVSKLSPICGKWPSRSSAKNCDSLRVAQRNLLRHKLADDQRNIGNCGDHQAHTGDFRDSRRHADGREPLRQPLSERGPRKRAGEYAIQSDPDLDSREKFARFGRERQRPAGADHLAVDHGLQTSAPRRHDRKFGHGEEAVEQKSTRQRSQVR